MTNTLYFLRGIPASGKSTWSRLKIAEDFKKGIITKRVNKDDLRAMIDNSNHFKGSESFIVGVERSIVFQALSKGFNIIVDNTNLSPFHEKAYRGMIKELTKDGKDVNMVIKDFDIELDSAILRDSLRESSVGEEVIRAMYDKFVSITERG